MSWEDIFKDIIDPVYGTICFFLDLDISLTNIGVDAEYRTNEKIFFVVYISCMLYNVARHHYIGYKKDIQFQESTKGLYDCSCQLFYMINEELHQELTDEHCKNLIEAIYIVTTMF